MYKEVDAEFDLIKLEFANNDNPTEFIEKAYLFAKTAHKDQIRKDGKPYISHPVAVALILAKLGFNEDVVSAALLHDVVEDCGVTLEDLRLEFNANVAELVDCVSAIDKEKFVFDKDDLYESLDFEKQAIEEQSFKKLIAIGKKNPLGFCIKFADRLHNLRTIEIFDYSKQLEKVKETERWIIPIAKVLNAEYFYRSIKNECFKIKNKFVNIKTLATLALFGVLAKMPNVYAIEKIEGGDVTIESLGTIIKDLATKFQIFGVIVAFVMLVVFTIQFIIADDEGKQRKKKLILYTLGGVALLILIPSIIKEKKIKSRILKFRYTRK